MLGIFHKLFIHSPVEDDLGGFQFLTVMSNDALTVHIHVFLWRYAFLSLG